MVIVYNVVLILLAIIFLPIILILFIIQPKFRAGFLEKLGFYSSDTLSKPEKSSTIVFHAVSVGETNAIKELVKRYRKIHPKDIIIVTTTTKTGQTIARSAFKDIATVVTYYPYDFFFSIISFFNKFKPDKVVIAETEIWPMFLSIAKRKGIKVYSVNGRISPHSYIGYKRLKFFLSNILNCYEKLFMQSQSDAQRIIDIGAIEKKVEVMGNLKFDIEQNLVETEIEKYSDDLKTKGYRIFIAASTHKGEEKIILDAFKTLKQKHSDAKLLLAPRHPERFEEVASLLNTQGLSWEYRSKNADFNSVDVILLDTMGELSKLYSLCYLAFIGGSFVDIGGHNPLEASIWEKPVISGEITYNFKDVYKITTEKKCAVIVKNTEELTLELISFYDNQLKYRTFCQNAKTIFTENRGAINYVLQRI